MLGELENISVDGHSLEELQLDVIRIVRHYVKEFYNYYNKLDILKLNCIEPTDVESLVYISLYNKNEEGVSNIDRYLINASKVKNGFKYLFSIIRKIVKFRYIRFVTDCGKKNSKFSTINFTKIEEITNCDLPEKILEDLKFNIEDNLTYECVYNSIPYIEYDCFTFNKKLNSRRLIDLLVQGYSAKDIAENTYRLDKELNKLPVKSPYIYKVKSEVISMAKKTIIDLLNI